MNKTIKETVEALVTVRPPLFIDGYNKRVIADGTIGTITTRIDSSNHYAVIVYE